MGTQEVTRNERYSPPPLYTGEGKTQIKDVISTALTLRVGIDPVERQAPEAMRRDQARLCDLAAPYRNYDMKDLAAEALRADGLEVPSSTHEIARAAASSEIFSSALASTAQAIAVRAFQEAPDSTVGWCGEIDVPNFQPTTVYRMALVASLKRLARGGTAPADRTEAGAETVRVSRFARQARLDEQDMIDDSLGLLRGRTEALARAAARLRPDLVYSMILQNPDLSDSVALFDSTRGNTATGGDSALASGSLQTALAAMGDQRENGIPLNLRGRHLVIPTDLKVTALAVLSSLQAGLAPDDPERIILHTDSRLGALGCLDPLTEEIRAGSAAHWLLCAAAADAPSICVAYLAGRRVPKVRATPLSQGEWGLNLDLVFDLAVVPLSGVGLFYSSGAA